jgi:2,3-bisphosphoglycerate-dependent phosphoglycerate mutase
MLYLLRHAESRPSPDIPEREWPLSNRGYRQARLLIDPLGDLPLDVLYASPYLRARQTIEPFARRRDMTVCLDPRFRERKLTDRWLDDHAGAVEKVWESFNTVLPGGESSAECQRRMIEGVEAARADHAGQHVLMASHGNAIGLYLNHLDSGFSFEAWRAMRMPALYAVSGRTWRRVATGI